MINDVTSRLWKFSDYSPKTNVDIAGDDSMYHILVCHVFIASVWIDIAHILQGCFSGTVSQYQGSHSDKYWEKCDNNPDTSKGNTTMWINHGINGVIQTSQRVARGHYSDVIMATIASQITSLANLYSAVYPGADQKKTSKLRVTGLWVGNSPVNGEFPAQMASNAENVPIWWRHHYIVAYFEYVIIELTLIIFIRSKISTSKYWFQTHYKMTKWTTSPIKVLSWCSTKKMTQKPCFFILPPD